MNVSTLLRLSSRNTLRRPARTAFTIGMVVVSVALLFIALSLIRGIFGQLLTEGLGGAGEVRIVTREFAQREETLPLYENLPDIEKLSALLAKQPGVIAAEPRITSGVTVTIGQDIGDVFARAIGANDSYFARSAHVKERLVEGTWFTGQGGEIVAGQWVVKQLRAKVGDELVLLGTTQDGSMSSIKGKLVGVIHGAGVEQNLLVPLERMQYLTDMPGGATELLLYGDDYHLAGQLAARLRGMPELSGLEVQPWNERDMWRSITQVIDAVQNMIIFIMGLLTALGIWNTMTMTVLERTSEIGVLRAMGMSRPVVLLMVVFEAIAISVVGGLLGLLLGAGPSWLLSHNGLHLGERTAGNMPYGVSETMHGQFDARTMVFTFMLGVGMALIGSFIPAVRAASIQPVTAMRSGR